MRLALALIVLINSAAFAGEPSNATLNAPPPQQPASTEILELRKALFESQIQNLANAVREIERELEKRKAEKDTKEKK
jgi:hypothetical protein